MSKYSPNWDLSTIPRDLLRAEYAKTIKPPLPALVLCCRASNVLILSAP